MKPIRERKIVIYRHRKKRRVIGKEAMKDENKVKDNTNTFPQSLWKVGSSYYVRVDVLSSNYSED